MKKMRTLASLVAVSALALSLSACGSDDGGDTDNNDSAGDNTSASASADLGLINDGTLTVCSDVPYPPFEDFDDSSPSGFTGFDIDIVQAVATGLELELAVKDMNFDGLQSGLSLNSGQCDVVASAMTITEDRAANLDFSAGYYDSQQSLLVPTGSDIASIDDLDGRKVGVQQGTTGKTFAEENATGANLISFPSDAEMFTAIKAGQVDALLQDLPVNLDHTTDDQFEVVETFSTDEQYGLAIKKGNTALVEAINGQLETMRGDGSYDEIYNTYFATN